MSSSVSMSSRWLVGALVIASGWVSACSDVLLASEPSASPSFESSTAPTVKCGFYEPSYVCAARVQIDGIQRGHERDRQMMQAQHEDQLAATLRAAGLDPDEGKGFWCFSGELRGQPLGECRRSRDQCIGRLITHERAGMTMTEPLCTRHAQAVCFRVTRSLKEGERNMCFDEVATCERLRNGVDAEGFVSPPSECMIHS